MSLDASPEPGEAGAAGTGVQAPRAGSEPDYFAEAFFHPFNKVVLAGLAILGCLVSGGWYLGTAYALAYLALVPGDERFRRSCRARLRTEREEDPAAHTERLVRELSPAAHRRFTGLTSLVASIEERQRELDPATQLAAGAVEGKLDYLVDGYLRTLHAADRLQSYLDGTDHDGIMESARRLRDEIASAESDRVRLVKQRNLAILDERVARFHRAGEELSYLDASLAAADDAVRLARDQVVATGSLGGALGELDVVLEELRQGEGRLAELDPDPLESGPAPSPEELAAGDPGGGDRLPEPAAESDARPGPARGRDRVG